MRREVGTPTGRQRWNASSGSRRSGRRHVAPCSTAPPRTGKILADDPRSRDPPPSPRSSAGCHALPGQGGLRLVRRNGHRAQPWPDPQVVLRHLPSPRLGAASSRSLRTLSHRGRRPTSEGREDDHEGAAGHRRGAHRCRTADGGGMDRPSCGAQSPARPRPRLRPGRSSPPASRRCPGRSLQPSLDLRSRRGL